jgi:hypothetical protein
LALWEGWRAKQESQGHQADQFALFFVVTHDFTPGLGLACNFSICSIRNHPGSYQIQNPFFRRFDVVRMNIERSPVANDEVLFRRNCNDSHLWMLMEQFVTNAWPAAGVVERDDHEIWLGSLYGLGDLRLFADFPDNFDVGLIRERCEYEFSHEPRTIRHEDPDSFFHCALPARMVWGDPISVR